MVKCENCGFLALRNRRTGLLDEAPQEYRWRAEIPTFHHPLSHAYSGVPICLVRAYPLHNEVASQEMATHKEIFNLIVKERSCAERGLFTPWQQGFTPKEHREMLDRQWMLEREERRDRELREWQERQEVRTEERHKEQMQEARRIHKGEIAVLGFGVTIAIIIITFVGAAIEASWISKWFGLTY